MPLVSVVIPCYNYGRFLDRAVTSVLNQTYDDFEVIIVDDCSTDNTPDIARTFTDNRVHYIRQSQNVGQSENRNTAIRVARGNLIAMLDADDWWSPDYLKTVLPEFTDSSVGLVYTFRQGHREDGTKVEFSNQKVVRGRVTDAVFVSNFIGTPIAFRKNLVPNGYKTDLSPAFNNLGVDWWLVLEISTKCNIVGIDKPLYNYLFHGNQISNNTTRRIKADRIIQEKFLQTYPGVISKQSLKQARFWRHIREGYYHRQSGLRIQACISYIKSCIVDPFAIISYKGLVSTLVKR